MEIHSGHFRVIVSLQPLMDLILWVSFWAMESTAKDQDRPCLCDQLQPMMRHPVDRLLVWLEKCHQFALCTVCIQHGQRQVMWTLHFETWAGYFKSMTSIKLSFFVIYHWDRNILKLFQPHTLLGTWYLIAELPQRSTHQQICPYG